MAEENAQPASEPAKRPALADDVTTVDGAAARIGKLLRAERPEEPAADSQTDDASTAETEQPTVEASTETEQMPEQESAGEDTHEDESEQEATEQEAGESQDAEGDADTVELDADVLTDALGIPVNVNDDGELRVRVKVDGEESDATLSEMVRRYQTDATLTNRGKQLAAKESEYSARLDRFEQETQQQHQVLAALLQAAQNDLNPFKNVNLEQLRQDEPAEYAATLAESQAWTSRMQNIINSAMQQYEQSSQQLESERASLTQHNLLAEAEKLHALIPKYDDALEGKIRSWVMKTYDLDATAVRMPQAWLIDLAHRAMQADEGKAKAQVKKVQKKPKFTKPGARRSQTTVNQETLHAARQTLAKDGSIDSAAAYFRALAKRKR